MGQQRKAAAVSLPASLQGQSANSFHGRPVKNCRSTLTRRSAAGVGAAAAAAAAAAQADSTLAGIEDPNMVLTLTCSGCCRCCSWCCSG
jgi:hypothetical protein